MPGGMLRPPKRGVRAHLVQHAAVRAEGVAAREQGGPDRSHPGQSPHHLHHLPAQFCAHARCASLSDSGGSLDNAMGAGRAAGPRRRPRHGAEPAADCSYPWKYVRKRQTTSSRYKNKLKEKQTFPLLCGNLSDESTKKALFAAKKKSWQDYMATVHA